MTLPHTIVAPWVDGTDLLWLAHGRRQKAWLAGEAPWPRNALQPGRGAGRSTAVASRNALLDRVKRRYGWAMYRAPSGQAILVVGVPNAAGAVKLIEDMCAAGMLNADEALTRRERAALFKHEGELRA